MIPDKNLKAAALVWTCCLLCLMACCARQVQPEPPFPPGGQLDDAEKQLLVQLQSNNWAERQSGLYDIGAFWHVREFLVAQFEASSRWDVKLVIADLFRQHHSLDKRIVSSLIDMLGNTADAEFYDGNVQIKGTVSDFAEMDLLNFVSCEVLQEVYGFPVKTWIDESLNSLSGERKRELWREWWRKNEPFLIVGAEREVDDDGKTGWVRVVYFINQDARKNGVEIDPETGCPTGSSLLGSSDKQLFLPPTEAQVRSMEERAAEGLRHGESDWYRWALSLKLNLTAYVYSDWLLLFELENSRYDDVKLGIAEQFLRDRLPQKRVVSVLIRLFGGGYGPKISRDSEGYTTIPVSKTALAMLFESVSYDALKEIYGAEVTSPQDEAVTELMDHEHYRLWRNWWAANEDYVYIWHERAKGKDGALGRLRVVFSVNPDSRKAGKEVDPDTGQPDE